ncbi:MAG: hypothetical protein COA97_02440 [Flavobacteriales bacterium]|nr:MAG: hypothetical protein COA97_02440 [Flavobacteriales bacterium]
MFGGKATTSGDNFPVLFRFNGLGDTLWTRQYGDTLNFQTGRHMRHTPDGGFILLGESSSTTARYWVIKTDSLGNIEWQQFYAGPQLDTPNHIAICDDGGYIFTRITRSLGPGVPTTTNILITKIDSLGNIEFTKVFGESDYDGAGSIEQTIDGGYIFGGVLRSDLDAIYKPYAIRLDSIGDTIWTRTYTPPTGNSSGNGFRTIFELPDGNFIGAGQEFFTDSTTFGRRDGLIIKLKPNGDTLWHKTYRIPFMNGLSTDFEIKDVRPTSDGGFICGGVVYTALPDTGNQDMWIFKIDSNGCVDTSNCWVSVGITQEVTHIKESLLVYPNPTSGIVTIEIPNPQIYSGVFQIIDLTGKEVLSKTINSNSTQLDVGWLPKGIYFYRYLTYEQTPKQVRGYSGKLVIQ